jgi:hypothetical protein
MVGYLRTTARRADPDFEQVQTRCATVAQSSGPQAAARGQLALDGLLPKTIPRSPALVHCAERGLDLDTNQTPAVECHEIDLAARCRDPSAQALVAGAAQEARGQDLTGFADFRGARTQAPREPARCGVQAQPPQPANQRSA